MKRYLFLATIMSIIACNDQAKKNSTTSDSPVVVVPMDKPLNTEAEKTSQLVTQLPGK
jgi:hypothetical protein